MRTMLLSFKPSVYENIYSGKKIFEHRRSFPDEPIKAYMYVSSPICSINGIVYFGKRHTLTDWEEQFSNDKNVLSRIKKYQKNYRYAMEISEFQETSSISLNQLRNDIAHFIVPQMYYYLDGTELLRYLEQNLKYGKTNIKHSFENIQPSQVCRN